MKIALRALAVFVCLGGLPVDAYAIVPCVKEQILDTDFVDHDRRRGQVRYRAGVTEMATAPAHELDATLTLDDAISGKRVTLRWAAEGTDDKFAHAAYLVAFNTALLGGTQPATRIRLTKLEVKGESTFTSDELLRLASYIANSYAITGGRAYVDAIHDVADELGLSLPDLMARR